VIEVLGCIALGTDVQRELDGLRLEVAELRASRRRLALADDADRRRIERALHDGVQQQLVGLAADLEFTARSMDADPAALKSLLTEMAHDVRQALEEAQTLADQIYPPLLETGGLSAALRSAAARANVPIRCLDVLERAGAHTPMAVTVLSEERALTFEIVVDRDLDREWLRLSDRVEALGGRLTIPSGPGNETRVTGSLPLSG
jgi:signal transduction histidine kinase